MPNLVSILLKIAYIQASVLNSLIEMAFFWKLGYIYMCIHNIIINVT